MNTNTSLFALMGGEEAVKRLVETFYDIVEYEPAGVALNILHLRGHGVAHSRLEQFNFLSGFLGGPKLYADKHGHSNVRKMHEHVVINAEARDAWLNCMQMAMDRMDITPDRKETIMTHFRVVAKQLQNAD